jgi:hypothetical protein
VQQVEAEQAAQAEPRGARERALGVIARVADLSAMSCGAMITVRSRLVDADEGAHTPALRPQRVVEAVCQVDEYAHLAAALPAIDALDREQSGNESLASASSNSTVRQLDRNDRFPASS